MSDVQQQFEQCLGRKDEFLRTWLRTILTERAFPPHLRLRGASTPLTADDALVGVLIEVDVQNLEPVAIGLSRAQKWKSGARIMKAIGGSLIDYEVLQATLATREGASKSFARFVSWVGAGWREVRHAAPEVRGFLAIHESDAWWDLDGDLAVESLIEASTLAMGPQ